MLFDLDGVLRCYAPNVHVPIEARFGLAPGTLPACAFHPETAVPAVRGHITRAQWTQRAGKRAGSVPAMRAFLAPGGQVVPAVLDRVREVRAAGRTVGLLTNATDTLPEELRLLGLEGELDVVFNSSVIGAMKPEAPIYEHGTRVLGLPASSIGFTDDQGTHVAGARRSGMQATRFRGAGHLRRWLERRLGD